MENLPTFAVSLSATLAILRVAWYYSGGCRCDSPLTSTEWKMVAGTGLLATLCAMIDLRNLVKYGKEYYKINKSIKSKKLKNYAPLILQKIEEYQSNYSQGT